MNILFEAIKKGDLKKVEDIVKQQPSLVATFDTTEEFVVPNPNFPMIIKSPNALQAAIYYCSTVPTDEKQRYYEIINFLLQHTPDIDDMYLHEKIHGTSALNIAAMISDLNIIQKLLSHGADITECDYDGLTALHQAVRSSGDVSVINYILNQGGHKIINNLDADNRSAIFFAALNNDPAIMSCLLSNNVTPVDVNILDANNNSPIYYAITNGINPAVIMLLVQHHADLRLKNSGGCTAIGAAVAMHNFTLLQSLLNTLKNNEIQEIVLAENILHHAISSNAPKEFFRFLINKDFDSKELLQFLLKLNPKDNVDKKTALHYAVEWDAPSEVIKALLTAGLDINQKDRLGRTPLHFIGNPIIAELLLDNGANINQSDHFGRKPLLGAISKGRYDTAILFHKKYVNTPISIQSNNNNNHNNTIEQMVLDAGYQPGTAYWHSETGRLLMKVHRYQEANQHFIKAMSLMDTAHSQIATIKYWADKSNELSQTQPFSLKYDINASFDAAQVLFDKLIFKDKNDLNWKRIFESALENELLKPFLLFIATDFLMNPGGGIFIRPKCSSKMNNGDNTTGTSLLAGLYPGHGKIFVRQSLFSMQNPQSLYFFFGTIIHELSHLYFQKRYNNNLKPYQNSNKDLQNATQIMIKTTLLAFANHIKANYINNKEYGISSFDVELENLSSWEIGILLSNKYREILNLAWSDASFMEKIILPDETFKAFKFISPIYGFYGTEVEEAEFIVRLLELIANNFDVEKIEALKPFVDFYKKFLIPDCNQQLEEMMEMAKGSYDGTLVWFKKS